MKKKIMITIGAVLCVCIAGGAFLLSGAPYDVPKPKGTTTPLQQKGYSLSTTLSGVDCYLDQLAQLKQDGMDYVELCLRENYEEQAALLPDAVQKIKAAGLVIWSIHLPFGESVSPAAPDETTRTANVNRIKQFVELTKDCGAKTYVIHGSYEPIETKDRPTMLANAILSLTELNQYMNAQGLTLALENLPRTCIGNSIEEMAFIAGQIPDLKFCFDTNHFTQPKPNYNLRPLQRLLPSLRAKMNPVADTPTAYAAQFADRIATVHMSDYDGVDECHWFPGQGIIDFQTIHNTLAEAGFNAPVVFEPNEKCKGLRTTGKRLIEGYETAAGLA